MNLKVTDNKLWFTVLLCFFLLFWLAPGEGAGEEIIVSGTPHKLNLSVAFLYEEANPDDWEPVFTEASKLLYNATEKQMQLGTVMVFNNCPNAKDTADILILNDTSGARANLLGLGKDGKHVWISQTHKSTSGTAIGQFGIVHELGHYVYNLLDEYKGTAKKKNAAPAGTPTKSPGEDYYCTSPLGAGAASIMDGGTTVSPNNKRTEFCTDPGDGFTTSHESGYINGDFYYVTEQQNKRGEACWTTIVSIVKKKYSITMNEPQNEPQNDTSGHQDVNWEIQDCRVRSVVSIDRSGSMYGNKIALAKTGAQIFVDLVKIGEDLGVTSFSHFISVNFPLRQVTGDATKNTAKTIINGLQASGFTSIGGGLRASLNEILQKTSRTDNEFIVLLSDGYHNYGENPYSVIPDLINENVKVYTIGVGDSDIALLQDIASQTKGKFFYADSAASLPGIFTSIWTESRGNGVLEQIADFIQAGTQVIKQTFIDVFNEEATFVLSWEGGQLGFWLQRSDGVIIDEDYAAANPDTVEFVSGVNYSFYRIKQPLPGDWEIVVDAAGESTQKYFNVQVLDHTLDVQFTPTPDKDRYVYPEKVLIEALVAAGPAVVGASVTGNVTRPDNTVIDVTLFDDGLADHGDEVANDGIYSNFFSNYSEDGVYIFNLTANNVSGVEASPDVYEEMPGFVPRPIQPFKRKEQISVLVTGVPDIIMAMVDIDPETLNTKSKGKFITAYIELPAPYDVSVIDTGTVELKESGSFTASALSSPVEIGDRDEDGVVDLMLKFNRKDVIAYLNNAGLTSGAVEFTVTGSLMSGEMFEGKSTIRVLTPKK